VIETECNCHSPHDKDAPFLSHTTLEPHNVTGTELPDDAVVEEKLKGPLFVRLREEAQPSALKEVAMKPSMFVEHRHKVVSRSWTPATAPREIPRLTLFQKRPASGRDVVVNASAPVLVKNWEGFTQFLLGDVQRLLSRVDAFRSIPHSCSHAPSSPTSTQARSSH